MKVCIIKYLDPFEQFWVNQFVISGEDLYKRSTSLLEDYIDHYNKNNEDSKMINTSQSINLGCDFAYNLVYPNNTLEFVYEFEIMDMDVNMEDYFKNKDF